MISEPVFNRINILLVVPEIKNSNKAFTLIELSIVIVIIALIVTGVIAGQSLVRQAKLRSVISESEQIKTAINTFKLQYSQLPGDFDNAFAYWGTACGASASRCNGVNRDKRIDFLNGVTDERRFAWIHLELADLYPGSFAPFVVFNTGDDNVIGVNIPSSNLGDNVGIVIGYDDFGSSGNASSSPTRLSLDQNVITFGKIDTTSASSSATAGALTSPEARAIDLKTDDGTPNSGRTMGGVTGATNTCYSGSTYTLDSTALDVCNINFLFK